jgi:hypothetical protein
MIFLKKLVMFLKNVAHSMSVEPFSDRCRASVLKKKKRLAFFEPLCVATVSYDLWGENL